MNASSGVVSACTGFGISPFGAAMSNHPDHFHTAALPHHFPHHHHQHVGQQQTYQQDQLPCQASAMTTGGAGNVGVSAGAAGLEAGGQFRFSAQQHTLCHSTSGLGGGMNRGTLQNGNCRCPPNFLMNGQEVSC
ncbi:unnamed protein product [Protopolystoma xenopodis]|uniref:Uncharacterized protein n=1 Tax=Protopolystoma xenopodis TaxID=117903 RepID=A0A3S5BTD3_9PLAT|nr:unnamed protein product [Protopolystoma xenopodis]